MVEIRINVPALADAERLAAAGFPEGVQANVAKVDQYAVAGEQFWTVILSIGVPVTSGLILDLLRQAIKKSPEMPPTQVTINNHYVGLQEKDVDLRIKAILSQEKPGPPESSVEKPEQADTSAGKTPP